MNEKIYSLDPIIDENAKVLILGSIPGHQSLVKQKYYGNPRNHFWGILFELFDHEFIEDYEKRIQFLHEHGIAVWDTIGACYREGSLDSKIKEAEPNDIEGLLMRYPNIEAIGCNGTKAYQTFKRHFKHLMNEIEVELLPSTSPIPGRYNKTFEGKVEAWGVLLKYLND
ncbi:DNA-deoxyinosine glycosylase [Halalkalibacillus sediminis]|uniref:DNA-deoxyinosine glycosylase n=1 Tax=Halalkalibacillus sediminis TaxID=2018042 RepID=A0A2I0QV36_9BACI|nr:DNA-deoxyinosine glycosylase [Halalkalibacillus sediminis]PKR78213.1 DNA-deoxyinosine glycosylase [Halalkalibacillus sediminis]